MRREQAPVNETPVRAYAIRRVNPFLGVLQVIETDAGRAVSANGVVWDIEVRAERPAAWGRLNRDKRELAYYRYGLWSLQDGLVSRPLAPHLESDPLTRQCQQLIACIRQRLEQLPFTLQDQSELWLFDSSDDRPLALLATRTEQAPRPSPEPRHWSASIGANGVPSQRRYPEAQALEAQVKQAAGFNLQRHWVQRQADGSGIADNGKRHIPAPAFPSCLLSEDWPAVEQQQRVQDFLAWISPALLTLQQLNHEQRQRLEKQLHVQAISVEHHWRLYPEIIDEKCLKAAIVQCRLQKANSAGG